MTPPEHKLQIMKEVYRVLRPGGRYAIHELSIIPDEIAHEIKKDLENALSAAVSTLDRAVLKGSPSADHLSAVREATAKMKQELKWFTY